MSKTVMPPWLEQGLGHIWLPYTQMQTTPPPLPVVASRGVRLRLADGRELIDGIASWWTAAHGYNHPHILAEMADQMQRLPHVMFGGLAHEPACRLASRLATLLPGDLNHVFFAESGSVSVEVAVKMAVQYWLNRGERRPQLVHFRHGYHGDTIGTMALCDPEEGMHSAFRGLLPRHLLADLPETAEAVEQLDAHLAAHPVAAMIVEPLVQGAGGMKLHTPAVLQTLRRLADKHEILLIFDEIFTGFGRTGSLFACERAGVVPDIVTLSKALTGGVAPLSAAIARTPVFEAFLDRDPEKALMHGPTYMAHALGCAAANASLDLFEREDRLADVARLQAGLEAGLAPARALPGVIDVRVLGGIGAVELQRLDRIDHLKAAFVERGVWIRPFGRIVYLTPPLIIEPEDLTRLTTALVDGLAAHLAAQAA
ncbi:MAG: adenosylmethionine--8-amino-7-oxononanoate transaminase [Rhodothalassiaceae bacterium]